MPSLLLELFSEEIPARMQEDAAKRLEQSFRDAFASQNIDFDNMKTYVTPRRLAVIVTGLPEKQPDSTVEQKGPRTNAPEQAVLGFATKWGFKIEELEKRKIGNDEFYFASRSTKGVNTKDLIGFMVETICEKFPWPKSMRWGATPMSWVRPLRSIICLLDHDIVPLTIGHITSGNTTRGHRFLSKETITIKHPDEYVKALKDASVIASAEERKAWISKEAHHIASEHGLVLKEDENLLNEVTGLVEWPVMLVGTFDQEFLKLPPEVPILEMRHHQKYFALLNKDGSLSNRFLITANMIARDDGNKIIAGNERVVRARLEDGKFFWEQDKKKPLAEWNKGLDDMLFHAKLGSMGEKVKRITSLSTSLSTITGADAKKAEQVASFCKADLVTGMVGEFPELQGVMGRYYALEQKLPAEIADAIRDHYKPQGAEDALPQGALAITVALADKLDSLCGLFAAGEKPTGSKDPFALRRSALGIIRIIIDNKLRLSLREVLQTALALYPDALISLPSRGRAGVGALQGNASQSPPPNLPPAGGGTSLVEELLAFFSDRLKVILKTEGVRHDLIEAIFDGGKEDDLVRLVARANAIQSFINTEDGKNLLAGYRRAVNIVEKEEKKDKTQYVDKVDSALLTEPAEKTLYAELEKARADMAAALKSEDYTSIMQRVAALRPAVDAFFEAVMVNAEDKKIRENRLKLLSEMRGLLDTIANFGLIADV